MEQRGKGGVESAESPSAKSEEHFLCARREWESGSRSSQEVPGDPAMDGWTGSAHVLSTFAKAQGRCMQGLSTELLSSIAFYNYR